MYHRSRHRQFLRQFRNRSFLPRNNLRKPQRRPPVHINNRCDWCQRQVQPDASSVTVDGLLLHNTPQNGDEKSCEQHYRDYCKYIKGQVA